MPERTLRDIVGELRALLACPKISSLPWTYGQGNIEPAISKTWPIDNKTLARAAVNALPRLMAAIEPVIEAEDQKLKQREDELLAEADAIHARRQRLTA